jgi:hypothetical protein
MIDQNVTNLCDCGEVSKAGEGWTPWHVVLRICSILSYVVAIGWFAAYH